MNLTKEQIAIAGGVIVVVIIIILGLVGVIPGIRKAGGDPNFPAGGATLEFWGVDNQGTFVDLIKAYQNTPEGKDINVNYRNFSSSEELETQVINALAENKGPDVFMVESSWLTKHGAKVSPANPTLLPAQGFKKIFPGVVTKDFIAQTADGNAYVIASPLYTDALALIYNKDIFNAKGIPFAPQTWQQVTEAIEKIRAVDQKTGAISMPAIALGTSKNIESFEPILEALILQSGGSLYDANAGGLRFDVKGESAVNFYLQFGNEGNPLYTWNGYMENAREKFAKGELGMLIDFKDSLADMQKKNSFLSYGVSALPQLSGEVRYQKNVASYRGLTVSRQSKYPYVAWHFIKFLTTNETAAKIYMEKTQRLPALLTLLQKELGTDNEPFAKGVLMADSWKNPDPIEVKNILGQTITNIQGGKLSLQEGLRYIEEKVNALYK